MKVITVANPKGGVAKSTVALHLAYKAAESGLKTLVIDMDMQGSVSASLEDKQAEEHSQTASCFFLGLEAKPLKSKIQNINVLSASCIQGEILNDFTIEKLADFDTFKKSFEDLKSQDFDLCIIDTAGVLGFKPPHTTAALLVSNFVVVPTTIGDYEARSLAKSWKYIASIRNSANADLKLLGILPCRINSNSKIESTGLEALKNALGEAVFPFSLKERAAVKQAIALKRPVWQKAKGESHRRAAGEWSNATQHILDLIMAR